MFLFNIPFILYSIYFILFFYCFILFCYIYCENGLYFVCWKIYSTMILITLIWITFDLYSMLYFHSLLFYFTFILFFIAYNCKNWHWHTYYTQHVVVALVNYNTRLAILILYNSLSLSTLFSLFSVLIVIVQHSQFLSPINFNFIQTQIMFLLEMFLQIMFLQNNVSNPTILYKKKNVFLFLSYNMWCSVNYRTVSTVIVNVRFIYFPINFIHSHNF